jgi:DNA-binding winged helix-turn-helix (wHTH) protein
MSKKDRIYTLLSDGEPHRTEELVQISHRFSAFLHILREEEGYEIRKTQLNRYVWTYQLIRVKAA